MPKTKTTQERLHESATKLAKLAPTDDHRDFYIAMAEATAPHDDPYPIFDEPKAPAAAAAADAPPKV